MMASISLPVGVSSACSVMETTRTPLRRSMDLKATACSRLRVKRENFQTRISLNGALVFCGRVDHLAELRAVGDATALGLIHVLAEDDVAVLLCVVPERPQLGGDGEVHVLAVTGDSGVEGHGRVVGVLVHRCVLLAHSWSFRRASARWRRSRRSHSRSSMYRRMASRRNSLMVRPTVVAPALPSPGAWRR